MDIQKKKFALTDHMVVFGFGLAAVYWLLDSFMTIFMSTDDSLLEQITGFAVQEFTPDVTVYLRLSLEMMEYRREKAGRAADRMEENDITFFNRIITGYEAMAKTEPHRFFTVDGDQPVNKIADQIWERISRLLK